MKTSSFTFILILTLLFTGFWCFAQSKLHPVGRVIIYTDKQGILVVDSMPAVSMTRYDYAVITSIDPGAHKLFFIRDSVTNHYTFETAARRFDQLMIRNDSLIQMDTLPGKPWKGSHSFIKTYYVPKKKGLFVKGSVGIGMWNSRVSPRFKASAGYQHAPQLLIGAGTGYFVHHMRLTYWIEWFSTKVKSDVFNVPFIPVYIDLQVNLGKKQTIVFFDFNFGISIPLAQHFQGSFSSNNHGYYNGYGTFRVDKISIGSYISINPGIKYSFSGKYFIDFSVGLDICINKMQGKFPDGKTQYAKSSSDFNIKMGFGF